MAPRKPKPPRPDDIPPVPRFKKRSKASPGGLEAALRLVRNLTNTEASPGDFTEFFDQLKLERNDRGAAILAATNTENALRYALGRRVGIPRSDYDNIFGVAGPMNTFDLKIRMGFALKIFRDETRTNLTIIRAIRNAFAHAHVPITFKTKEIAGSCRFLVNPFVLFPKGVKVVDGKVVDPNAPKNDRELYNTVCQSLAHNLIIYGSHCSQTARHHPDFARYDVWLTPEPLP